MALVLALTLEGIEWHPKSNGAAPRRAGRRSDIERIRIMFGPVVDKTIEEILNLRVALRRFAAAQTDPVVRFHVDCLDDGLATACGHSQ